MYIPKRTYSYYFRLQIPKSLRLSYGKAEICFSLNTLDRKLAKRKSLSLVEKYLVDFEKGKANPAPIVTAMDCTKDTGAVDEMLVNDNGDTFNNSPYQSIQQAGAYIRLELIFNFRNAPYRRL